ncbi:MAG: DUF262 domain-containing protein [Oscillospiraceae bacterium]|nr:DUF262 domain-containing protein [Oscillospiraceae bacterium]
MKAEDPSRPLPEVMTAEPVSPAEATEARVPYLTGAQDADPSRERESDPITALTDPALDDGFLSGTALSLSTAAATRESLWSLLSVRGLTVRIPAHHRDYVQGRHDAQAEPVRRRLLGDLSDVLREAASDPAGLRSGMDLGFLCGSVDQDRGLIPMDGQQRLTTLFLLHWLLAFRSGRLESDPDVREALLRFHYEGREPADRFCRQLVLQAPSTSAFGTGSRWISSEIRNCAWFSEDCEQSLSVRGMLVMLDALQEMLTTLADAGLTTERLFSCLTSARPPVSFLFLNLGDAGLADSSYIKMNARGRPLSFFEGFKAELSAFLASDAAGSGESGFSEWFLRQLNGPWTALFWRPEYRESGPFPTTDRPMLRFFRFVILTDYLTGLEPVPDRGNLEAVLTALMGEGDNTFFSRLFRDGFRTVESLCCERPPVTVRTFQRIRALLDLLASRKKRAGSLAFLKRSADPGPVFDEEAAFRRLIASDPRELGYRELLLLYAEYRFLLRYALPDGSFRYSAALARWLSLIFRLSGAVSSLQADAFFAMVRAVDCLVESGFALRSRKAILRWPRLPEALSVFPASQLAEEAVKAALMQSSPLWKKAILAAGRSFLGGRIDLLFRYSGIRAEDVFSSASLSVPATDGKEYALFLRCLRRIELLFDRDGVHPELELSALLQRALLCYGGEECYLLPSGRTRLCFLDSKDRDFGFRRLLWEENDGRRALFLQLLDDLDEKQPAASQLQRIISRKIFRGVERWKEYFVTMPEILSSVRLSGAEAADPMGEWVFRTEKRFIRMNHPDDILLLSRTQTGSVSREYYSYVLFLKARKRGLPVFYHADYTESSEKYAWFEDSNGARIRILYRNPDGTRWRCLAYREEDPAPVFGGSLEETLDYIRESSR